jgi:hypothetical protein
VDMPADSENAATNRYHPIYAGGVSYVQLIESMFSIVPVNRLASAPSSRTLPASLSDHADLSITRYQ